MKWKQFDDAHEVVVNWGLGLDSSAVLLLMAEIGVRPRAIIFSDPGSEWPETYAFRDDVFRPWLKRVGFPDVTIIDRNNCGINVRRHENLYERSIRTQTLPSAAYGRTSCSLKFKAEAINAYLRHQEWCQEEWEAGRRIIKVIGYEAGEKRRYGNFAEFKNKRERREFVPYYPLVDWGIFREDLPGIFERHGLPVPRKSACWFCPYNTDEEWLRLREEHPLLFRNALLMEKNAAPKLRKPDVVGLRRRARVGERSLVDWVHQLDQNDLENLMTTLLVKLLERAAAGRSVDHRDQGCTLDEFVRSTGKPRPSVRRTANKATNDGLFEKRGDPVRYFLTAKALKLLEPTKLGIESCEHKNVSRIKGKPEPVKTSPKTAPDKRELVAAQDEGVAYRPRMTPCKKCGAVGTIHACCPKCQEMADGVAEVERAFGFRTVYTQKDGHIRVAQPQCRECRRNGLRAKRAAAKKAKERDAA